MTETSEDRLARMIKEELVDALEKCPEGRVVIVPQIVINASIAGQDAKIFFGGSEYGGNDKEARKKTGAGQPTTTPFTQFGNDPDGWDPHGTGRPGLVVVRDALNTWVHLQQRMVSVQEAAKVLNIAPAMVRVAADRCNWLCRAGDSIEADGEG